MLGELCVVRFPLKSYLQQRSNILGQERMKVLGAQKQA